MAISTEILATYRRPGAVVGRLLAAGVTQVQQALIVVGACVIMFIAQWPATARRVFYSDPDRWQADPDAYYQTMMFEIAGSLIGVVVILPLLFFALSLVSVGVSRLARRPLSGEAARVALFWALLAAAPLTLLNGLVAGMIGPGIELTLVGLLWFVVFLWFWFSGLRAARLHRKEESA